MRFLYIIVLSFVLLLVSNGQAGYHEQKYEDGVLVYWSHNSEPKGTTIWSFTFNGVFTAQTKTLNSTHMEFIIKVRTTGTVGFGIEDSSGLSDYLLGGVNDSTNQPYGTDRWHVPNSNLAKDTKIESDWIITRADQDSKFTSLTFVRLLKTEDPNMNQDVEIKNENVYVRWLYGDSDQSGNVTAQGRSQAINLIRDGTADGNDKGGSTWLKSSAVFIVTAPFILTLLY